LIELLPVHTVQIFEKTLTYDGDNTDVDGCKIKESNKGLPCTVSDFLV
jgi:hypothetical protein